MKKRFLLLGSVLIFGNVVCAVAIERPQPLNKQFPALQQEDGLHTTLVQILHERGLEHESAMQKVQALFEEEPLKVEKQLAALQSRFKSLTHSALHDYLATQALFAKKLDLASYDTLVRMLHAVQGTHPDTLQREALQEIARNNREIV